MVFVKRRTGVASAGALVGNTRATALSGAKRCTALDVDTVNGDELNAVGALRGAPQFSLFERSHFIGVGHVSYQSNDSRTGHGKT